MRNERIILKLLIIILIAPAIMISCSKEPAAPVYNNFVSKEVALQLTKEYLGGLIDLVSATNPEVAGLKPLISSDVIVYKIVYKTKINNQDIDASGLVCVPATPGNYPVLSFQNGTNTLNSSAPSELPSDYSYQLVELLSSLGYIVVIADYPGFGESSAIPHPYLVTEPTVRSLVDILYAVKEMGVSELPGISVSNKYYLLGYSQGGWASLALHKALELDYSNDFELRGSACGAGPYDIYILLKGMVNVTTYPMPVYIGYIVNAYIEYNQFSNSVSDILNQPYASRISSLYNGQFTSSEINGQLTTSIPDLINPDFLAGFVSAPQYASVRDALINNSISAWHTNKPLLLLHGSADTQVDPKSTDNMHDAMIGAGTPVNLCTKVIIPGADHGSGLVPAMVNGILFINNLRNQGN